MTTRISSWPTWTMTRVTRLTPTSTRTQSTTCATWVSRTVLWLFFSLMCHTLLAQVVLESVIPSQSHPWCAFLSEFFDFSFSFHPHFLVFFFSFSFLFMYSDHYSDDLDSVITNLRDSAKGSNDGYDVAFSLTLLQFLFPVFFFSFVLMHHEH